MDPMGIQLGGGRFLFSSKYHKIEVVGKDLHMLYILFDVEILKFCNWNGLLLYHDATTSELEVKSVEVSNSKFAADILQVCCCI